MAIKRVRFPFETPYTNTISVENQPAYPGDEELERKIRSLIRWNAMAMVVRANSKNHGIGGHISSYASSANFLEVALHHFLRGADFPGGGDQVFFQGHAAPGIYARAFLEGRLSEQHLNNYRTELATGGGLSSYPHPYSMPEFWEFPTVSMGLGPLQAIYQARHNRYMKHRGLKETDTSRVWAFLGDGEMDEPESMGSLTMPAREGLNNLIFVINCNLQRLDGPVRGNGKIIQELESLFLGAGWNVAKVIWGRDWDPLLAQDAQGVLVERMNEAVDGEYQKFVVEPGSYTREHFFGKSPELLKMVEHLADDQIRKLGRGGHDSQKIYAAFKKAVESTDKPTVVLAKTIKGYGLGDSGEGKNITHQQKKLNEKEIKNFRDRFDIPIPDDQLKDIPFYRPADNSAEIQYLIEKRQALGGFTPRRRIQKKKLETFDMNDMKEFMEGTAEGRDVSTTMAFSAFLSKLLRHPQLGKIIVPIVPDEARTFGMDPIFRQVGIYSSAGQLYEPVDAKMVLYYRESIEGQLLEEGITEAGALSAFIAAGTSEASHQVPLIPMFVFYSMFGFQRVGDLIWSLQDSRCRGFLFGGTYGRTTLAGEGLQHQDGHSLLFASAYPRVKSYEPAFAYELVTIIQDGIRRMYGEGEEISYYITLHNENYRMWPMPQNSEAVREGILKGMYLLNPAKAETGKRIAILGSGSILMQALKAQEILGTEHQCTVDVWSVTSYTELRREALAAIKAGGTPWVSEKLSKEGYDKVIAVSDNVTLLPDQIARWVPNFSSLGTDGLGLSENRESLRKHFQIDAKSIVKACLS